MAKRRRGEEQTNLQTTSVAAVFNHRVLRKLHNALSANPEIDLLSVFPGQYSTRLSTMQKQETTGSLTISGANLNTATSAADESADSRCFDGIPTVVFPLSDTVKDLLEINTHNAQCSQLMAVKLHKTIKTSSMIWQSQASHKHAVFRCNANVVVKVVPDVKDYTEYTSMQYLLEHAPGIPVPRPLGLVVLNARSYIFMSFIPGLTLDKVWPTLPQDRKISIRDQLNDLLLSLKELRRPDGMPLGGTSGEGCKDTRRQTRICQEPITTTAEFEDFLFSNPHFGGPVYIAFLRRFLSSPKAAVVFSHGDIRPENIVVQPDDAYLISGILDWEKSGFYPDYFESIKAASNMSTSESDDWYLYLPACADPARYHSTWLVDRLWDIHIA